MRWLSIAKIALYWVHGPYSKVKVKSIRVNSSHGINTHFILLLGLFLLGHSLALQEGRVVRAGNYTSRKGG
jgi:hypothetical protein